jgi:hypothetical protein
MSKGSAPRPVHNKTYGENFDRIFRPTSTNELKHYRPIGHMAHKDCGWPFCDCKKECEKVKNAQSS